MQAFNTNTYPLIERAPGLRVGFPVHSATGTASTATVLFELDPARSSRCTPTAPRSC